MSVYVTGIGSCVPADVVTNDMVRAMVGEAMGDVEAKAGIHERRWVREGTTNAELAESAIRRALDGAGITPADLDALIVATLSPDAGFPGTGVFVQRRLQRPGIPALDVRNQCSGFLYGLSIARAWLMTNTYQTIALVGSEIHSTGLDKSPQGAGVTPLFGDGAGAVILSKVPSPLELIDVRLGADGQGIEALWCELPASGLHPNIHEDYLKDGRQFPKMSGRTVFRKAVETLEVELNRLFQDHAIDPKNVILVPHQSNLHLNRLLADRLGIQPAHLVSTIEDYANMTAASLPVTLERALLDGLFVAGAPVVLAAFGSGYTWGSALLRVTESP